MGPSGLLRLGQPRSTLNGYPREAGSATGQTALVWPGMAMGYWPLASGMAGGLESQV